MHQHVACGGAYDACVAYADTCLGADERDLACVHSAELGDVDGKARCWACAGGGGGCGLRLIDLVCACNHFELFGPDACVDLYGSGQYAGVVGGRCVKACAIDVDVAALHQVAIQTAAIHDGCAGGQGGAAGVDKAAAVDVDARWVGNDDLGALACDFNIAVDVAGVGAVDLVQDHSGAASSQHRVACGVAAQLSQYVGS